MVLEKLDFPPESGNVDIYLVVWSLSPRKLKKNRLQMVQSE